MFEIFRYREKICFVQVATNTGVNKVIIAIVAAGHNGAKMIDGHLTASFRFADAAVAAAIPVALADFFMFRVRPAPYS